MADLTHAICPDCGKEARNEIQVMDRFGTRNFQGRVYVQSWCKDCRTRERRENRLNRKQVQGEISFI